MDGSNGFFFSFDAPAEAGGSTGPVSGSGEAVHPLWPPASTSTSQFSWIAVDDAHLAEWAALYCTTASPHTPPPKPRRLTLPPPQGASSTLTSSSSSFTLCYQTSPEVHTLTSVVDTTAASPTATEHRDVIPGRYYGGLKVWSCAPLLAEYLSEHAAHFRPLLRDAAVVVELGCGQALPGLAALCLGARSVVFQDYNAEVLQVCTKANLAATVAANQAVLLPRNSEAAEAPLRVKFVHGDWVDLQWEDAATSQQSDAAVCDVILGADVTFDKEACDKLACVLQRWLRRTTGEAIIASKDYYFGTNGGYLEFTRSAEAQGLAVAVLRRVDTADKMPHVVLRVTHRSA